MTPALPLVWSSRSRSLAETRRSSGPRGDQQNSAIFKHSPLLTLGPGLQRTTTPGCGTPCCRRQSGYVDLCLDINSVCLYYLCIIQLSYYCKHPSNALKEPRRSEEMRFHVFDFLPSAVVLVLSVAAGSSRASQSILVCLNVPACG